MSKKKDNNLNHRIRRNASLKKQIKTGKTKKNEDLIIDVEDRGERRAEFDREERGQQKKKKSNY